MSRPTDWSPLADSDPVHGDTVAVSREARYYASIADEIDTQVNRLKTMATQNEMLGKTADKLRDAAGDLKDKLEKTHGRFAAVGDALGRWPTHLETAQTDTLAALNDAKDAAADVTKYAPPTGPAPTNPTPDQQKAETQRNTNHGEATKALTAAKNKFDAAVTERDRQAKKIADEIRDSLHDGLKDGFWDHIGAWIDQHLALIKMIVEVLSWVATIVAVIAIFCTPFGWVALLAIGLTAAVLAGHVALALSGNGSWTDVAIDVFAIATLGLGMGLSSMARGAEALAAARGGVMAGADAARGVETARGLAKAGLESASSNWLKATFLPSGRAAVRALKGFDDVTDALSSGAFAKAASEVAGIKGVATFGKSLAMLDHGGAESLSKLSTLAGRFGGDATFDAAAAAWRSSLGTGQIVRLAGSGVDFTDKILSPSSIPGWKDIKPSSSLYSTFKETTGEDIGRALHLPGR